MTEKVCLNTCVYPCVCVSVCVHRAQPSHRLNELHAILKDAKLVCEREHARSSGGS